MQKKKKKKRVLKVKNILIFICILLLFGYLFYYTLTMPIKNIYISDNKIISDNEIISISSLDDYPSFLLTLSGDVKKNLLQNEYIESVVVKKKLGNRIEIKIKEYKPLAIIESENLVIMSSGDKLDNRYNLTDVPVLMNEVDSREYEEFIKMFSRVDDNVLRQISQIEYSPVDVDRERFLLYMDDGNLVYITLTKIDKLNKYNSIKVKMDGKNGIIYLDSGDYVKLKSDNKDCENVNGSTVLDESNNCGND